MRGRRRYGHYYDRSTRNRYKRPQYPIDNQFPNHPRELVFHEAPFWYEFFHGMVVIAVCIFLGVVLFNYTENLPFSRVQISTVLLAMFVYIAIVVCTFIFGVYFAHKKINSKFFDLIFQLAMHIMYAGISVIFVFGVISGEIFFSPIGLFFLVMLPSLILFPFTLSHMIWNTINGGDATYMKLRDF